MADFQVMVEQVWGLLYPWILYVPSGIILGFSIWSIRGSRRRLAASRLRRAAAEAHFAAAVEELRMAYTPLGQKRALEAEARAMELLVEHLDDKQLQDYKILGYFTVRGSEGGRYRLRRSSVIKLSATEVPTHSICIGAAYTDNNGYPVDTIPAPDIMLANKLMIEANEKLFKSIGISSRI